MLSAYATLVLVMVVQNAPPTHAQSPIRLSQELEAPVTDYDLRAVDFLQALAMVAAQFRLPMGIEVIESPAGLKPIHIRQRATTARKLLVQLLAGQPGYSIDIRQGVVHISPSASRADPHDILNIRLKSFEVSDAYVQSANEQLLGTVRSVVSPSPSGLTRHTGRGGIGTTGGSDLGDSRISLSLRNATVRSALDRLCLAGMYRVWLVDLPSRKSLTPTGFLQVASPFDRKELPGGYQPTWALLRWGTDPMTYRYYPSWLTDEPSH